jgi:hypothetical protein
MFQSAASKMRNLEGYSQQREKLASLGTMAAGLAHELNNPARRRAARRRICRRPRTKRNPSSAALKALEHDQWQHLGAGRLARMLGTARASAPLDHLERSDRADKIATWLEAAAWPTPGNWLRPSSAPTWTSRGWRNWRANFPRSHADALGWLESRLNLKLLLSQVEQSTGASPNWSKP